DAQHGVFVRYNELRVRTSAYQTKDAIPDGPLRGPLAECGDLAGILDSGNVFGDVTRSGVASHALENIRTVERSRAHAHEDLTERWRWCGDVADFENIRIAV